MVTRAATRVGKKPFLLVTGDEFLRRNKIASLLAQLLPGALRSTHLVRIYPDDFNWPSVFAQASTPSLLGGTQVFWISQVDRIKKVDWSHFASYLDAPSVDSFFIFEADRLPRTHALVQLASRFKLHVDLSHETQEAGFSMLREKARQAGKKFTQSAWHVFSERLGGAPQLADLCLDQLILYVEDETIDERAVEQLATRWLRYEPFDLAEALARKNAQEAIEIFHYFYDLSGDVTSTIGLIHWQLRRIWQAKNILARGGRRDNLARSLRIPPFRFQAFLNQVRQFDLETLEALLQELWQIDWKVKTGACEPAIAVEMFLAHV